MNGATYALPYDLLNGLRAGSSGSFNNFAVELVAKRLALLDELVPKAARVAVLLNPASMAAEPVLRDVQEAARAIGLQTHVLNASTSGEIDAALGTLACEL
jgi:putative ABC transport system substrate-binding protein